MTAATLVFLLSANALAQRYGYPTAPPAQPPYGQYPQSPGYNQPGYGSYNYDYDDYQFDRHLDWWDRELNLSRRQEREIRRVRDRFNSQTQNLTPRDPRQREALRQLRQRQFYDMMAVLRPDQRARVIERMHPYELTAGRAPGRGYGNGPSYGRGPGYNPYGY